MINEEIEFRLFELQDEEYRSLQSAIVPTVDAARIIGVRLPALRAYAKEIVSRPDIEDFLHALPHRYYDEDQLHAAVISDIKDYGRCINEVERFLPYVDNWATCDALIPAAFRKRPDGLTARTGVWLRSPHVYTVRFGIGTLMRYYLGEGFDISYARKVASVEHGDYYVRMMVAWYFATALAKRYDQALPFIEQHKLDVWTHNKAIQKSLESYRVTPEHKEYLRSLKIKA